MAKAKSASGTTPAKAKKASAAVKAPPKVTPKIAKTPPRARKTAKKAAISPSFLLSPKALPKNSRVRVWWPPTDDVDKSDLSGMYWPAVKMGGGKVKYDNGEVEQVKLEYIVPHEQEVMHGQEKKVLEVGEFCEISNGSKTDPGEWFGRVRKVHLAAKKYTVGYPFHDTPDEDVPFSLVRRARVLDEAKGEWKYVQPSMSDWKSGKYESPFELKLVQKKTLDAWINATVKQREGGVVKQPTPKKKASTVAPMETSAPAAAAAKPWCVIC